MNIEPTQEPSAAGGPDQPSAIRAPAKAYLQDLVHTHGLDFDVQSRYILTELKSSGTGPILATMTWTSEGRRCLQRCVPLHRILMYEDIQFEHSYGTINLPTAIDSHQERAKKERRIVKTCKKGYAFITTFKEFFDRSTEEILFDLAVAEVGLYTYVESFRIMNRTPSTFEMMFALFKALELCSNEEVGQAGGGTSSGGGSGGGGGGGDPFNSNLKGDGRPWDGGGGGRYGVGQFFTYDCGYSGIGGLFHGIRLPKCDINDTDTSGSNDDHSDDDNDMNGGGARVVALKALISVALGPVKASVVKATVEKNNDICRGMKIFFSKNPRASRHKLDDLRSKVYGLLATSCTAISEAGRNLFALRSFVRTMKNNLQLRIEDILDSFIRDQIARTVLVRCSLVPRRGYPVSVSAAQFTEELNHAIYDVVIIGCVVESVSWNPGSEVMTFVMSSRAYEALRAHGDLQVDCDLTVRFSEDAYESVRTLYAAATYIPDAVHPMDFIKAYHRKTRLELEHDPLRSFSTPEETVWCFAVAMSDDFYESACPEKIRCRGVPFRLVDSAEVQELLDSECVSDSVVKVSDWFNHSWGKDKLKRCGAVLQNYGIDEGDIHVLKETSTEARMIETISVISSTGSPELKRSAFNMISQMKGQLFFDDLKTFTTTPDSAGENPTEFITVFARKVMKSRVELVQYAIVSYVTVAPPSEKVTVDRKVISCLCVAAVSGAMLLAGPAGLMAIGAATAAVNTVVAARDKISHSYQDDIEVVAVDQLLRTGVASRRLPDRHLYFDFN